MVCDTFSNYVQSAPGDVERVLAILTPLRWSCVGAVLGVALVSIGRRLMARVTRAQSTG